MTINSVIVTPLLPRGIAAVSGAQITCVNGHSGDQLRNTSASKQLIANNVSWGLQNADNMQIHFI